MYLPSGDQWGLDSETPELVRLVILSSFTLYTKISSSKSRMAVKHTYSSPGEKEGSELLPAHISSFAIVLLSYVFISIIRTSSRPDRYTAFVFALLKLIARLSLPSLV